MKHSYLLIFCLLTFGILSAQEENLSKEERERREKNIQAGNPFAKYGYRAKVATLSKGKYLEVHDLDSIVTIGTVRWNVNQNKIVGNIIKDTTDMYAQPIGDVAGRWLSPDPLSDEFPEWSPYTTMNDNPINFIDPTGMASEWVPTVSDAGEISYIAEKGDSANSMSQQFGISQSDAEAITGTTGDTQIAEGTSISGEQVANVTGNEVMKLDLTNSTVTGADIANQAIFSVRNEFINDQFWRDGGNGKYADFTVDGNDYFSGMTEVSSRTAGGALYGFGGTTNINIGGINISVGVDFSGANNGLYSNEADGRQRILPNGNSVLEFFHPTAYPSNPYQGKGGGLQGLRNPVMSMTTSKPGILNTYLQNGN